MAQMDSLLKRPLYVFDLPKEILSGIRLKNETAIGHEDIKKEEPDLKHTEAQTASENQTPLGSASCTLCGVSFKDAQEQRRHVKSDLHRYNLKQKIRGLQPVDETEFDALVNDLDESISGSESSDSDQDDANEDTLTALLKKQAKIATSGDHEEEVLPKKARKSGRPPLLWFTADKLPPNISLGIYRAIFTGSELENGSSVPDILRQKQLRQTPVSDNTSDSQNGVPLPGSAQDPHYFLCMIGGGHFAAMVVSLSPKPGKHQNHQGGGREATVLAHKTFHRYTTRRKQGGAQSANDSAKGAAHSAGSSLRRYNEAALTNEIRELLQEWRSMIDSAQLLFVRASGSTNRRTLYGPYEGQVLRTNDARLRSFPFNTRRATQAELMRAFVELTRVKVSEVDEAALAERNAKAEREAASKQAVRPDKTSTPAPPKISEEEAAALLHTSQVQSLIRRSKAPAVVSYITSNSISPNFHFHPPDTQQNHHAPTPLHLAASIHSPSVVLSLLTKAGADPTIVNNEGKKTAFDLAGDRPTRDAFRVARHILGEEKWDWDKAHIPPALSKEEAEKRDERDRKEREQKEEARRKAEMEKLKLADAGKEASSAKKGNQTSAAGKKLGAVVEKTAGEKREEETRGLTPEARMRLERERRARAAEERIRAMQNRG
ncbi:MAG: hypothetical protein M1823_004107 [Watsoniomyces obsoletus]|nr:MAG: hypothetical protein M1823_004107 [Watsoniomyces obsoletus]